MCNNTQDHIDQTTSEIDIWLLTSFYESVDNKLTLIMFSVYNTYV